MANSVDWKYEKAVFKSLKRQTVYEVLDFSSQYGSEFSSSYAAGNVVGEPINYPAYGDFTDALVFRTYGKWWQHCPATQKPIRKSNQDFISNDFVDVKFVDPVYPTQVEVYETYNPGAVVRILACDYNEDKCNDKSRWFVLWAGTGHACAAESRMFSPTLTKCPFKTRRLRVEFDQRHLEYYTEIDAIVLYGLDSAIEYRSRHDGRCRKNNGGKLENLAKALGDKMTLSKSHNGVKHNCPFFELPSEVVNKIFSYLNFSDLAIAAKVCKYFKEYSYDPHWFKELDLQPYWPRLNDSDLKFLGERCVSTRKLNMSWCGACGIISPTGFISYLKGIGMSLSSLSLSCCTFINCNTLLEIKKSCPLLEEFDLSCCQQIDGGAFKIISDMICLTRLNLYRTKISNMELSEILRCCTKLKHLNLGGCFALDAFDEVAVNFKYTPNMTSLDLWRVRPQGYETVKNIADNCLNLEEIDLGWSITTSEISPISYLAKRCRKLKKLFLTAVRCVCDADLLSIAENCADMEQLDILGTSNVSRISVERVLRQCHNMKFFDVSFCAEIDREWFEDARSRFPNVSLKKSVN